MKTCVATLALCLLFGLTIAVEAQPILSIDFNERVGDQSTNTANNYPGFDSFLINSNTSITAAQSTPSIRTFGSLTVTIAGLGNPAYDDRLRATPVNAGAFTLGAIYRDFVFQGSSTNGDGLSVTIDGLTAGQYYKVTIWSYDTSSGGNRVSDWSANGLAAIENYTFNGSTLPTNDTQNQFSFEAAASGTGQLLIQGRRDAATSSAGSVFLNALQLEATAPHAPTVTTQPVGATVFAGDNPPTFSVAVNGAIPFAYQWRREGVDIANGTNSTLTIANAQAATAGRYSVVITNAGGSATSSVAQLTVLAVDNIRSGLIAHWPLNQLGVSTPDVGGNMNTLSATNMDSSNLGTGRCGPAPSFNGTDEYLTLNHNGSGGLPASSYPAYSVALWVKGNFAGQLDRRVFAESSTNSNTPLLTIGTDNQATNSGVDIFIRTSDNVSVINHRKSSPGAFDGNWHHIAWVDNNGFPKLYIDGVPDTNDFNYARGPLNVTTITLGAIQRATAANFFNGMIDDVAVWRRSLSAGEVQYVKNNGPTLAPSIICPADVTVPSNRGFCSADGVNLGNPDVSGNCSAVTTTNNAPAVFPFGTTIVTWTATDLNGNTNTCTQRVTVIDGQPPTIAMQPQSRTNAPGTTATFSVAAASCGPVTYQWCFGTNALAGETNATLAVANVQCANVGNYSAKVSNVAGTSTSVGAMLSVNCPPIARNNSAATRQNRAITIAVAKLLSDDSDPDGDPLSFVSASATSTNGGAVTSNGSSVTYTPAGDFAGFDRFSYTITDGQGYNATADVEVLVVSANAPSQSQVSLEPTLNGFLIRFAGIPGRTYDVQRATDVAGPWTTLASPVAPPHGIFEYEDTNPPQSAAFYRTVAP